MKKTVFILIFLLSTVSIAQGVGGGSDGRHANAASRSEIGFFGGGATYLGDINPFNPFREINAAVGIIYKYNLNSRFAVRANINYLRINASDHNSKEEFLQNRNLNFRNDIFEVGAGIELNFIKYRPKDFRTKSQRVYTKKGSPFSPYMFLELAYFYHNPKGLYNGKYIALRNLGTEGQGLANGKKQYSLHQVAIPFGAGFKFNIGKNVALAIEYTIRMTFTDYLDDVSGAYADYDAIESTNGSIAALMSDRSIVKTGPGGRNTGTARGTGANIDWYQTFGMMISFKLGKGDRCFYKF